MPPEWKKVLEIHKPWIDLVVDIAEVDDYRYALIFVDDFSDWKEYSIYTVNKGVDIEKVVERIEKGEDVDEIADAIGELIDEFIIGETPEELSNCVDEDYISPRDEEGYNLDDNLIWPLCFIRDNPSAWIHLRRLYQHNLLPDAWIPYVKKLLHS